MHGSALGIDYLALACSFDDMTHCVNTTSNLNDYGMKDFDSQVHFSDLTIGREHLGLGFTKWTAVEKIGLPTVPSQVDRNTQQIRIGLGFMYHDMLYYEHKTRPLRDQKIYGRVYPYALYGLNKDLVANMNNISEAVQA